MDTPRRAPDPDQVRWLTPAEQQVWRSFLQANLLLFAQLDRELVRDAGVPMAYYELLVRLSEAPDHRLRMSDLADFSNQSRSRLTHAINRLSELGWVEREVCESDRRGAFAVLTEEGWQALVAAAPVHVDGVRRHLFDQLTPEQVQAIGAIGEAVAAPLRGGVDAGPNEG
jgi:DNA-binding MarR family transcriptional regulator